MRGLFAANRGNWWEADERPEPCSLGLLPSGPDPVGEWLVHRQPPGLYIGPNRGRKQAGRLVAARMRSHTRHSGHREHGLPLAELAGTDDLARRTRRTTWSLHPQLAATPFRSATCALSRVLLMNDANYPWLILVPRRPGLSRAHRPRRRTSRSSCWARSPPRRARSRPSPNATSSTSPRSATWCRNCTCTSSRAAQATPPGRSRCGALPRRPPTIRPCATA